MQDKNQQDKIHVLQVVGDPVGGIRKHVHSILDGLGADILQSYAYSVTGIDSCFEDDLSRISSRLCGILPLVIRKKPGVRDVYNIFLLFRYVRRANVDIIHGHGAKGGMYARIVAFLTGKRSIYTPHGGVVHKMFSAVEGKVYALVEKMLYGITDYFVFESKYTADSFHRVVGRDTGKWIVNYNGIELPDMDVIRQQAAELGSIPDNALVHVGVFGMLREQKGQEWAIKACSELTECMHLHLFGDGPDCNALLSLVNSSGLTDNVTFHGDVSDVLPYMYRMDVVLIPSLFESFGYVAVEAMALQKPVIATNVGGLNEVLTDEGCLFVPPASKDGIVAAVRRYLDNRNEIDKIAMSGRDRVAAHFSEQCMLSNLENLYKNLLARK